MAKISIPVCKFVSLVQTNKITNNETELFSLGMNEEPSVYLCDLVVARKEHACGECHGTIFKGEKYHKHHGVWGGRGETYKTCIDCENLRTDIDKDVPHDERTAFGGLCESVFERGEVEFISRFLETKAKRAATILPWMAEQFDSKINKEDEKLEEEYERDEQ